MYAHLDCIQSSSSDPKSPVLFIHGFPDSPLMFAEYMSETERKQPWLAGRGIYTYAFPNRHTNPNFPSFSELAGGVVEREFDQTLDELARQSPTGKLIIVAHDWGATHAWRWARSHPNPPIERMAAFSVGSSFRYDVFEHGLNAFTWLYGALFCSAWYLPFMRKLVADSIQRFAGYRSDTAMELWRDAYHYWDRPSLLLTILPQSLFFLFYRQEYLDFPFPVLYMRTGLDRIASTAAFERLLLERSDCRLIIYPEYNHWFPEQHSDVVLPEIRKFMLG